MHGDFGNLAVPSSPRRIAFRARDSADVGGTLRSAQKVAYEQGNPNGRSMALMRLAFAKGEFDGRVEEWLGKATQTRMSDAKSMKIGS